MARLTARRVLDAFCGAGGASRGYQLAGFHVTGVDIRPQPHYCGDAFVRGDALTYLAEHWHEYDLIHASPTCQNRSRATKWRGQADRHPDTLTPTLVLLRGLPVPWVVENVTEAATDGTMRRDVLLCGSMFGLPVRRHRIFEIGHQVAMPYLSCRHGVGEFAFHHKHERAFADAMGCRWMSNFEARQAIPPIYTTFLASQVMPREQCCA